MSGTISNGEGSGELRQHSSVLVQLECPDSRAVGLKGEQPMTTTAGGLELKGLRVPKAYDSKLSPLAGDTVPLDHVVVHPENEQLQASPVVGFSDTSEGVSNGSNFGVRVNSKRSSSILAQQQEKKLKVVNVPQRANHFSSLSPTSSCSSGDMSVSDANVSIGRKGCQPLLTTTARKGGRNVSADTVWDFNGPGLLESYFPDREVSVFVGTWNMGEMKDLPDSIDDFILPVTHNTVADVFVVGLQECSCDHKKWEVLIQQTLGPSHVLVQSVLFGALHLAVFIRRDLLWYCSSVKNASFSTKPGSIARTKGGIGVCLTLFGSSFLFINSHLTAYEDKVAERNADFMKIISNLPLAADGEESEKDLCNRFDYVFWCGDLNYRIDMSRNVVENLLRKSDYMNLLLQDQLTKEILKGNIFQGFSEQPIGFSPTYKYDFFSDQYDTSEKQRVPSWTDRILFKSANGSEGGLVGIGYSACSTLLDSDHRPVYGMFKAVLKPPTSLDGIPDHVTSFDVDVYNQANTSRKEMASLTLSLREKSEQTHTKQTNQTSSAVCTIL